MANPNKQNCQLADGSDNGMIAGQQDLIADAAAVTITDADASLGATTQAELEGYFNVAVTKINAILDVLEAHGLMSDS